MTYGSSAKTPAANLEELDFVDVSSVHRGSFLSSGNLNNFLGSPLGQAQANLLREQIAAQGVGVTDSLIRRALLSEQSSQDMGYARPDIVADDAPNPEGRMTETALIDAYGPGARKPGISVDPAPVVNRNFGLA